MEIRGNTLIQRSGLRCLWHPTESHLRHIRSGGTEILRGVYFAVRDADWDTVAPSVLDAGFEDSAAGWRLWQDLHWQKGEMDFKGRLVIEVSGAEALRFRFEGQALSEFESNRIGFLILHGAECAGGEVVVEKTDGSVEKGRLPAEIAPWQPFTDIRAIVHWPAPGMEVCVRIEGEAFEMEDQRNWTDASFKTYSTPLSEPFPRRIRSGTRIIQQVTVSIRPSSGAEVTPEDRESVVRIDGGGDAQPFPFLGFEDSPGDVVSEEALRALKPDHLRVEIHAMDPAWRTAWRAAVERAKRAGAAVETALFLDAAPQENAISQIVEELLETDVTHARWLVFIAGNKVTQADTVDTVRQARDQMRGNVPLFAGTDAFFTEVNRERPPTEGVEGIVFSSNPSVHATDDLSLVETLAVVGLCVENAKRFGPGKVCVSPLTFKMRRNPNATTPEGYEVPVESQVDRRQWTPWGAAWTLGALKYLAESGTFSVTCFKTAGPAGIFRNEDESGSSALVELFRRLAEWKGAEVVRSSSSRPLEVVALFLRRGGDQSVLVANFASEIRIVDLRWNGAEIVRDVPPGVSYFLW